MISIRNIEVKKDTVILNDLSVDLKWGTIYGVIGKSGAGKSTFLNAISGQVDVNSGEILFDNKKVIGPSEKLIPGVEGVEYVYQDFGIEPFHTVAENIKEKVLSLKKDEQETLVERYLDLVELKNHCKLQARYLSGGEKQRLAIARALVCRPKLLLLDEPFVHIDHNLKLKIQRFIRREIQNSKLSVIIVSHDGAELIGFTDELIYIRNCRIEEVRASKDVFYKPIDKVEGELLGFINEVNLNGQKVLFRPNQYSLEAGANSLSVTFLESVDTGLSILNTFRTSNNEEIIISSDTVLNTIKCLEIKI